MLVDTQAAPDAPPRAERLGNGRFFENPTYHFETLRALGYVSRGGAEPGEVLETVKLVPEGDAQSWYAAWAATADRVAALAEATKDPATAGAAWLRAHNYQRTAEFLLPPDDSKRPPSWKKVLALFYRGLDVLGVRYERIAVPYGGGNLRTLYFPGPAGAEQKPLIVLVGGFDSILEELYFVLGVPALQRGYSVLMYEGPGQGQPLRDGMKFTPEWEKPTGAVLDAFLRTHARPLRMVLVGMSMGGYLAPRAAAFESRIDGVVAFDYCFDVAEGSARSFAALAANPAALKNPDIAWGFRNAQWTLGTTGVEETRQAFAPYTLAPVAARIRQDVLVLAGTEDQFNPIRQLDDFQKALVNARSVTTRVFDRASGGAAHCQAGNLALLDGAVFDWLLATFPH